MSSHLLMIEDDARLAQMVGEYLGQSGMHVTHRADGAGGLAQLQGEGADPLPDLVILDLMLPDMDGLDVCRRIRALQGPAAQVPVLMLTAKGDPMDRIIGLELGADDYVAKPVSPRVLVARLRALLRRQGEDSPAGVVRVGDITLDEASRRVTVGGSDVVLTGAEFNLLALLVRHAGHVVPRDVLAEDGLGRALQAFDRRIETHMAQIRRKLGPLPDGSARIQTVRGAGYQYVAR